MARERKAHRAFSPEVLPLGARVTPSDLVGVAPPCNVDPSAVEVSTITEMSGSDIIVGDPLIVITDPVANDPATIADGCNDDIVGGPIRPIDLEDYQDDLDGDGFPDPPGAIILPPGGNDIVTDGGDNLP